MAHDVTEKIEAAGDYLISQQQEADDLGRMPDKTVALLKDIGVVRMLQPKDFGGMETDPRDFFDAVMTVGHFCPSAGWVAGVVGVHPWELAFNDERLQDEVWGQDPDTWFSSPYAPGGIAVPTEGGYIFNGRWSFSSGADACDWVVLGAIIGDETGAPVEPMGMLHIMVPRADYEIVDDSWNVMGLAGTGSKDIIIKDAFVPDYRAIDVMSVMSGEAAKTAGRTQPLYQLPWSAIFPNAIAAGVIGIAEGLLNNVVEFQAGRISVGGVAQASDSYTRTVIGEAASDIRSARAQLLFNIGEMYEAAQKGHQIPMDLRVATRRDQVRVAWRAAAAADMAYTRCGGNAIRLDKPLQRFYRGMHAGLQHAIFVPGPVYDASAGMLMGFPPEGPMAMTF